MTSHEHPSQASILALLAGRGEAGAEAVRVHLGSCASCGSVAQDWSRLREALSSWSGSLPAPRPLTVPPPAARPGIIARAWHAMTVVAAQVPVVRRQIWAATALVAGVGYLAVAVTGVVAGTVLALTAPVTAAIGLALIYGPDSDPCAEISLSCPVPPRTVLLARLVVVAGYDLAVGFAATLLLAGTGGEGGLWSLVTMWLGPLLAMSALSVLLSVVFRSWAGVMTALCLWTLRVITMSPAHPAVVAAATGWLWSTTPATAAVAAVAIAAAVFTAGRREILRDGRPLEA
jgi:hypothetical protein